MNANDMTEEELEQMAGLVFKKGRFYVGMWFCGGSHCDLMGAIYRDNEDQRWQVKWRLRVIKEPDPFSAKDEKTWYVAEAKQDQTAAQVQAHMQKILEFSAKTVGLEVDAIEYLPIMEDGSDWFIRRERLKLLPEWMHMGAVGTKGNETRH